MFEEFGSDYTRKNLDLDSLLPGVNQSEVSSSMLSTVFQRWLTKPEVTNVAGTIGFPLTNVSEAILETTTGRQAYQLSPVYSVQYGTEETILNWADILRKAAHTGIDPTRYREWGKVNQMNFAPPIALDKFIHYNDYFWANPDNVTEKPDYVTITRDVAVPNAWSASNKWYTQAQIESPFLYGLSTNPTASWTGIAKQAVLPIIEFDDIELNTWSQVHRTWNHRQTLSDQWTTSITDPTDLQIQDPLFPLLWELVDERVSPCVHQPLLLTPHAPQLITQPTTQVYCPAFLFGQDAIIVHHNGKRVFNYIEVETPGSQYSTEIQFLTPVVGSVEIFHGAQTAADVGREDVVTKVLSSAAVFTDFAGIEVSGTIRKNLTKYRYTDQVKSAHSQQPRFNLYDVATSELHSIGTIWEYVGDPDAGVTPQLNKRIWVSNGREDFKFSTDLATSTNELLAFKHSSNFSTIWRGPHQYVPRYVNQDRVADGELPGVSVPPGSGTWEPSPLLAANPMRETRRVVRYSEIAPHFKSISEHQPPTGGAPTDWSLGGIIKIAHGGEIHWISSMIAKHIAMPNLINFIIDQTYAHTAFVEQQATLLLADLIATAEHNAETIAAVIYSSIKTAAVTSGTNDLVFQDSATYNVTTGVGFPNLVPSLAMYGIVPLITPTLVADPSLGVISLTSHTGSKRILAVNKARHDSVVSSVVATGSVVTANVPPLPIARNALWLNTSTNQLMSLVVDYIATSAPQGLIPTGKFWLETPTNVLYQMTNLGWVIVPTIRAWHTLDTAVILAQVQLLFETDLHKRTLERNPQPLSLLDINTQHTALEASGLTKAYQTAYKRLVRTRNQTNTLTRSYVATKAFTWWYGNTFTPAINAPYPTIPVEWANTTLEIYSNLYGTSYPHREPWCLQGYINEPTWWKAEYSDQSRFRVWTQTMWENIAQGIVPPGYPLPDDVAISSGVAGEVLGCVRTSVNTTDYTTSDGILPDGLLPPYWVPVSLTDQQVDGQQLLTNISAIGSTTPPSVLPYRAGSNSEFIWRWSDDFVRARLQTAHAADPFEFYKLVVMQADTIVVGGLTINTNTHNVHSQLDSLLGDNLHSDRSLMSLVVLFSRYNNLLSVNDSPLLAWKSWTTKLAYQTGSLIVPQTLRIYEECSPLTNYKLALKRTENVKTISFSNLIVTLNKAGSPLTLPAGTGDDWEYKIDTSESIVETRRRYGMLRRSVTWKPSLLAFQCVGSAPWITGEAITIVIDGVSSVLYVRNMPHITTSSHSFFQLCDDIDQSLISQGTTAVFGMNEFVAEAKSIESTFHSAVDSVKRVWEYIVPDRNEIIPFEFPVVVTGIQNLIDFIHSYVRFMEDDGVVFAYGGNPTYDPDTQELVDWNQQVRRMLSTIYNSYGLSNRRYVPEDSYNTRLALDIPYVELNPFRDRIWVNTPEGVICNIYNTPYTTELQSTAAIYDDIGDPITSDVVPLRTDRITTFFYENKNRVGNAVPNQNKFQHIGSGKVSVDYYEHALLFDAQTAGGLVIYDPFLNIQKPTMRLEFQRSSRHFYRPTMGGFVVTPNTTLPNLETTAQYQRQDWNVNNSNELIQSTTDVRTGMGKLPLSYFQNVPVTSKTEFQFWQKMIRQKGTKCVVDVFTKHTLYDQKEVDEFWAWKLGTFGAVHQRDQIAFNITSDDLLNDFCNFRFST